MILLKGELLLKDILKIDVEILKSTPRIKTDSKYMDWSFPTAVFFINLDALSIAHIVRLYI